MGSTYTELMSINWGFLNMSWQSDQPYNRLPPLPPEEDVESRPVLKACITARAALAELKKSGHADS